MWRHWKKNNYHGLTQLSTRGQCLVRSCGTLLLSAEILHNIFFHFISSPGLCYVSESEWVLPLPEQMSMCVVTLICCSECVGGRLCMCLAFMCMCRYVNEGRQIVHMLVSTYHLLIKASTEASSVEAPGWVEKGADRQLWWNGKSFRKSGKNNSGST